jgi:hypothetical protein
VKVLTSLIIVIIIVSLICPSWGQNALLPFPDKCGPYDREAALRNLEILGDHWGYSYDSLLQDLSIWSQSPYVIIDSLGASVLNRALWQLTITSDIPPAEPRRTVHIHARTHPNEVQAWWVTDEMINLLLSEDPFSQFMREKCTFYIIPMYNPDGVELEYPRENAHGIDLESNWNTNPVEPEVAVLRQRFIELMASPAPIEVALNMHSAHLCKRYFVFHDSTGTSPLFTVFEQDFIEGIRSYFPNGIEPWYYFITWTSGTPLVYPESWFWLNHAEAVMALTYEDMNCTAAGNYDMTAYALLHGIVDYLELSPTAIVSEAMDETGNVILHQSYPNPVKKAEQTAASVVIEYQLSTPQSVKLELFDVLGRKVITVDQGYRAASLHRIQLNTADLSTGKYFYRLQSAGTVLIKQLTIIK